jgi:hypothetical protein
MIHSGESSGGRVLNFFIVTNLKIIKPPCFSANTTLSNPRYCGKTILLPFEKIY